VAIFCVSEFYEIGVRREVSARRIDKASIRSFWQTCDLGKRIGMYVFCVKTARGLVPWYIGKTYASFAGEVFQPHKIEKYNDCLAKIVRGNVGLVFVYKEGTGRPSEETVLELEREYINKGFKRNDRLLNDIGRRKESFKIKGLEGSGRPSKAVAQFRQAFGI